MVAFLGLCAAPAWAADAMISGSVTDRNGEPLARARVSLEPGNVELVTDRDGRFEITFLRDDTGARVKLEKHQTYALVVFKPGFHDASASVDYRRGILEVEPVTLVPESIDVEDIAVNLDPNLYLQPTQSNGHTVEGQ